MSGDFGPGELLCLVSTAWATGGSGLGFAGQLLAAMLSGNWAAARAAIAAGAAGAGHAPAMGSAGSWVSRRTARPAPGRADRHEKRIAEARLTPSRSSPSRFKGVTAAGLVLRVFALLGLLPVRLFAAARAGRAANRDAPATDHWRPDAVARPDDNREHWQGTVAPSVAVLVESVREELRPGAPMAHWHVSTESDPAAPHAHKALEAEFGHVHGQARASAAEAAAQARGVVMDGQTGPRVGSQPLQPAGSEARSLHELRAPDGCPASHPLGRPLQAAMQPGAPGNALHPGGHGSANPGGRPRGLSGAQPAHGYAPFASQGGAAAGTTGLADPPLHPSHAGHHAPHAAGGMLPGTGQRTHPGLALPASAAADAGPGAQPSAPALQPAGSHARNDTAGLGRHPVDSGSGTGDARGSSGVVEPNLASISHAARAAHPEHPLAAHGQQHHGYLHTLAVHAAAHLPGKGGAGAGPTHAAAPAPAVPSTREGPCLG